MDTDYNYFINESVADSTEIPKGLQRSGIGPSPFEISLMTYKLSPWTNRSVVLNEWFNYGFNPTTWTQYCLKQMMIFKKSNEMQ